MSLVRPLGSVVTLLSTDEVVPGSIPGSALDFSLVDDLKNIYYLMVIHNHSIQISVK